MGRNVVKPWVRQAVHGVTFALLLVGLLYAGFVNQLLMGTIPNLHRGILIIGFIAGVAAASSYVGVYVAKRLLPKERSTRRR